MLLSPGTYAILYPDLTVHEIRTFTEPTVAREGFTRPVIMTAQPNFNPVTQQVLQNGWTVSATGVTPNWEIVAFTQDELDQIGRGSNLYTSTLFLGRGTLNISGGALYLNGTGINHQVTGQAAQNYNSLYQQDIDISGSLATRMSVNTRVTHVPFVTAPTIWTNETLAPGFFAGSNAYCTYMDLSVYTGVRFVVNKGAATGAGNSAIFLRYLDNFSATPANYRAITNPEMRLPTSVANVMITSGFVPIIAAAKSGVYLAVITSGGDGALDPAFGHIAAQFM